MHFDPRLGDHGLPYDPIMAIVSPRPIGWISTLSTEGVSNLAPYSFFNLFCKRPPIVGYACDGDKDTLVNIRATGEFVCNVASLSHIEQVNASSARLPHGTSEFEAYGIATAPSRVVAAPRVADAACALECRLISTQRLTTLEGRDTSQTLVLGEVVSVYMDERYVVEGRLRVDLVQPLARCGYRDYAGIDRLRERQRPGEARP